MAAISPWSLLKTALRNWTPESAGIREFRFTTGAPLSEADDLGIYGIGEAALVVPFTTSCCCFH